MKDFYEDVLYRYTQALYRRAEKLRLSGLPVPLFIADDINRAEAASRAVVASAKTLDWTELHTNGLATIITKAVEAYVAKQTGVIPAKTRKAIDEAFLHSGQVSLEGGAAPTPAPTTAPTPVKRKKAEAPPPPVKVSELDRFQFGLRVRQALEQLHINDIQGLLGCTPDNLLSVPKFGYRSLLAVEAALAKHGLQLKRNSYPSTSTPAGA